MNLFSCLVFFVIFTTIEGNEIGRPSLRIIAKRSANIIKDFLQNKRRENGQSADGLDGLIMAVSVVDGVYNALHNVRKTIVNRLVNKPVSFGINAQLANSQYHSKLMYGPINIQQYVANLCKEQQNQQPNQQEDLGLNPSSGGGGYKYDEKPIQQQQQNENAPKFEPNQFLLHDANGENSNYDEKDKQAKANIVGYVENNFPVILLNENEIRKK